MRQVVLCLVCSILATFSLLQFDTMAQAPDELVIFAASSLTNAFTELSDQFEEKNDLQLTLNFAGSSTLSAQLQQGASVDIFASANPQQMEMLVADGLIQEESISIFAENELVIITPRDNLANIQSAEDLAGDDVLLVLAAPSVPIREYSNQLFDNLIRLYGDDFPSNVLDNLVSEEPNVRQIVARIALGEADAGLVYRSDVTSEIAEVLQIIDLPEGMSPRAIYPIAPLLDSENVANAELFIDFVLSDEGQSILREWKFCSPDTLLPEQTPEAEMTAEADDNQETETSC